MGEIVQELIMYYKEAEEREQKYITEITKLRIENAMLKEKLNQEEKKCG